MSQESRELADEAEHTHPEWRQTLKDAREAGWTLETYHGHAYGQLRCPQGICQKKILRTAKGTENVARQTRNLIRNCSHRADLPDKVGKARRHLDTAERLLDAAANLLAHDDARDRVEELLQEAEAAIASSAHLNSEFDARTKDMTEAAHVARAILRDVGLDPRSTPKAAIVQAGRELAAARSEMGELPKSYDDSAELRYRRQALKERAGDLRRRLS